MKSKQRKMLILAAFGLGLAVLASAGGEAVAGRADQDANDGLVESSFLPGPFGGPGEVPTPFDVNQRVELADGEEYLLSGRLMSQRSGRIVFRVDLLQHPWLATRRRMRNPFYAIDSANFPLEKYVDMDVPVRLKVIARSVIIGSCGTASVQHRLSLLAEPVPASLPLTPEEIRNRPPRR